MFHHRWKIRCKSLRNEIMLSLSFVPILYKLCYAQSSTYSQIRLLICTRKMFEETLAVSEINLKVNDPHFEFKYHTSISVFSQIFCTANQFPCFIISGKLVAKSLTMKQCSHFFCVQTVKLTPANLLERTC